MWGRRHRTIAGVRRSLGGVVLYPASLPNWQMCCMINARWLAASAARVWRGGWRPAIRLLRRLASRMVSGVSRCGRVSVGAFALYSFQCAGVWGSGRLLAQLLGASIVVSGCCVNWGYNRIAIYAHAHIYIVGIF